MSADLRRLRQAFRDQRNVAKARGIDFLLTFEEWLNFWQDSGRLFERGRKEGQYCMARFGDTGPYALGNIKIIKHSENSSERICTDIVRQNLSQAQLGKRASQQTRNKMSQSQRRVGTAHFKGKKHTPESKVKIAEASRGKKRSEEQKARMSDAQYRRWSKSKGT
jgi:NUMOD3 motif